MRDIYAKLQLQPFPSYGETLEMVAKRRWPNEKLQRKGSLRNAFFQPFRRASQAEDMQESARMIRIKRPIDFRLDGSPICQLLTLDQILLIYATVLEEKRLVVISSSLRYF